MKKRYVFILAMIGFILGYLISYHFKKRDMKEKDKKIEKFKGYYTISNLWIGIKNDGKSTAEYFRKYNYTSVAVYGMGELGQRLCEDLSNSEINIKYTIDQNTHNQYVGIKACTLEDELELVDVVVVTATFDFYKIAEELETHISCPIVSLEEVVYDII